VRKRKGERGGEGRGGERREGKRRGWRGGEESGRWTCLPPRFDNPGYGPEFGTGQRAVIPTAEKETVGILDNNSSLPLGL